jgi:hypothetical protein
VECLVPFDARLDSIDALQCEFPWVQFIDCRDRIDSTRYGAFSREHHDLLRAAGLRAARAPIVAFIEDHEIPAANWVSAVLQAHRAPDAGIGGAIDNQIDRPLNWAVYFCDFARYQSPPVQATEFISDANSSYKRAALDRIKSTWWDTFHETTVNGALLGLGETLRLVPEARVYQARENLTLRAALLERYVWGRSFAGTRACGMAPFNRALRVLLSPALPFLLTYRILRDGLRNGSFSRLSAAPLILLLQTFWAAGEFAGYITGRPDANH